MRKVLYLALVLSTALTTVPVNAAADIVRLGNLKFAHYGAVWYMKEIAPKYNLRIEEKVFTKGLNVMPGIIAGEIDVAASALDAAIAGKAVGAHIYVVAGFARGGSRIVGRTGLKMTSVAELKGKKVGVTRGGAQELGLLAELAKAGLTWSDKGGRDVEIIYIPYTGLNAALSEKKIDAMCQSEPQSTQAINQGIGVEIVKPYDNPAGEPVRTLIMTRQMYEGRRDVAARVLKCFVEATKLFLEKPDFAEKYVRETVFKGQLSHEDYRDAMSNAAYTYDITSERVQAVTDCMRKFGVAKMETPPAASQWVKLDLLEEAKTMLGVK